MARHLSAEELEAFVSDVPFVQRNGVRLVSGEPGRVVGLVAREGNGNHLGTMYAGALFTLGEMLGGALAGATFDLSAHLPIVSSFTIDYLAPATTDVTMEVAIDADEVTRITDEAHREGKAWYELHGEMLDESGTVVARTHGTYQLRSHELLGGA
jgi:acyl-coenzyme A thioesterase PaaI-like protein